MMYQYLKNRMEQHAEFPILGYHKQSLMLPTGSHLRIFAEREITDHLQEDHLNRIMNEKLYI